MSERSALRVHGRAAWRPDLHTRARAQSRCPGRSARRESGSRQVETDERCPVFFFFSFSFLFNVSARQPLEELRSYIPIPPRPPPAPPTPRPSSASPLLALLSRFSTPERSSARARGCERAQRLQRPGASLGSGQSG